MDAQPRNWQSSCLQSGISFSLGRMLICREARKSASENLLIASFPVVHRHHAIGAGSVWVYGFATLFTNDFEFSPHRMEAFVASGSDFILLPLFVGHGFGVPMVEVDAHY